MKKVWAVKARHYLRHWCSVVIRDTVEPLFDKKELFRLLSIPILLLLIFLTSGAEAMALELLNLGKVGTALLLTLPIWFALNLVLAPFRVWREEKAKGRWFGSRFVYHLPQIVFTTLITPDDDGKEIKFEIVPAEANTLVTVRRQCEGGIAKVRIEPTFISIPIDWNLIERDGVNEVRVDNSRKAKLVIHCPQNSSPTIARIEILSWEV